MAEQQVTDGLMQYTVVTLIIILVLICVLSWKVARRTEWVDSIFRKLEKYFSFGPTNIVTQISTQTREQLSGELREQQKQLGKDLGEQLSGELREQQKQLGNDLRGQLARDIDEAFSRHNLKVKNSPISLSVLGEEIAEAINASKVANYYVEQNYRETAGMNAYEVQEHCFAFADNLLDDIKEKHPQDYQTISQVAFYRGQSITSILGVVVGIELRDAVLAKHGKAPTQVEKDKPSDIPKGGV